MGAACVDEQPSEGPRTCLGKEDSERPEIPLAYETEHLDIYVDDRRFLCAGSAVEYERFVTYVAEQLDMDIQRRIPVYAMHSTAGYCSNSGACVTPQGTVYALPFAAYHELTHGVACELRSGAPPLLAEGLAESLEPEPYEGSMVPPEDFAEVPISEFNVYYADAGHFVRFLLENDSPEVFKQLYRTANRTDGVWQAVEAAYGESIGEEYVSGAPQRWLRHRQCADLPLLEREGEGWQFAATFDCDDPQTLGPYERTQPQFIEVDQMYQSFLIEIEEAGTYRIDRSGAPASIRFERCAEDHLYSDDDKDDWAKSGVYFTGQGYGLSELHPGVWRFDVLVDHGPAVEVGVTIAPHAG